MRKLILINFILVGFFSLLQVREVFPWDNNVTHKDLSEHAADNSVLSKNKGDYLKNLGFNTGLDEVFTWQGETLTVTKWLRKGAYAEDAGSNFQGLIGMARYNNHFHNPLKPWGSAGLNDLGYTGASTVLWAQYGSWQASKEM
jgi:hypothetical protein